MWTDKTRQAQRHMDALRAELDAFGESKPYGVATTVEPRRKKLIYIVSKADAVPVSVSLRVDDVLQCLRSALDHLVYQLYIANNRSIEDREVSRLYFPIAKDEGSYPKARADKTNGLSDEALSLIDQTKPYKDGNNVLWKLHALNNIGKHRTIVTVSSRFDSVDVGSHAAAQLQSLLPGIATPEISLPLTPAYARFPLQVGDVLFEDSPGAKPNPKMPFWFGVALNEPGVSAGEDVTTLLHAMVTEVVALEPVFAPLL